MLSLITKGKTDPTAATNALTSIGMIIANAIDFPDRHGSAFVSGARPELACPQRRVQRLDQPALVRPNNWLRRACAPTPRRTIQRRAWLPDSVLYPRSVLDSG